jgi:hypothetical protein
VASHTEIEGPGSSQSRGLFSSAQWTPTRVAAAIALTIGLAYLCYGSTLKFIASYPSSYTWSDLLISYEGGPVRRGLLGEIAFLLHPFLPAHRFLIPLLVGTYFAMFTAIIWIACGRFRTSSLIFLATPSALLFPFGDPQAFGRKETLFLAAFLFSAAVLTRLRSPALALALMMAIYVPLILTHEIAGLSFALAVVFLFHTAARDRPLGWIVRATLAVAVYVLVMIAVIGALKGTPEQIARMAAAWQAMVPGALDPPLSAAHLADALTDPFSYPAQHVLSFVTIASYVFAFILSAIPLVWWFAERRLQPHPVLGHLGWVAALVPLLAAFLLMGDWGRALHMLVLQVGIMQLLVGEAVALSRPVLAPQSDRRKLAILLFPLTWFGFSWTVLHWVPKGDSAFVPGALFRMLGKGG